jgi:thymidine phosphorylase
MNQPIGRAVGNASEVAESIEVLRGGGPDDTRALTVALGAEMLALAGVRDGASRIGEALDGGAALEKFREIVRAQGGDPRVCDDPDAVLPRAPSQAAVRARRSGTVAAIDAEAVGTAVVLLGGGRRRKEDRVDPAVGVTVVARLGDEVREGDPLALLHHRGDPAAAAAMLAGAYGIADEAPPPRPLVHAIVRHREAA